MNASVNSSGQLPQRVFLSTVVARSCGVRPEDVDVRHFFSLPEFLVTVCFVATVANLGPFLLGILLQLKRFWGYVRLQLKRFWNSTRLRCCAKRRSNVVPAEQRNRASEKTGRMKEGLGETRPPEYSSSQKEEEQDIEAGVVEDVYAQSCDEEDSVEEEDSERSKIMAIWFNVCFAGLTLYTVWSYFVENVPRGASYSCLAAHTILIPLFKPAAISMWSAMMPVMQYAHWQSNRLSERPEEYARKSVLPGIQPFAFNWLSFLYASTVALAFLVYLVSTIFLWPLLLLFSYAILSGVIGFVFTFMHAPMEIMRGRATFCCRCRLWCYGKGDLLYLSDKELKRMAKYLPKGVQYDPHEGSRQFEPYLWKGYSNANIFTLKAMAVVPTACFAAALFFFPMYQGSMTYDELLATFAPAWNFAFDVQLLLQWPTGLGLRFQIAMILSIGLLVFDLSSRMVWSLHKAARKISCFDFRAHHFRPVAWVLMVPLKFGIVGLCVCELLWEVLLCIVLVSAAVTYFTVSMSAVVIYCSVFCCCLYRCKGKGDNAAVTRFNCIVNMLCFAEGTEGNFTKPFFVGARAAFAHHFRRSRLVIHLFRCWLSNDTKAALKQTVELNTPMIRQWVGNNGRRRETVNVSNHYLGDHGAIGIAKLIRQNHELVHNINVSSCEIGDLGAKALANALKTNRNLRAVNLQGNHIGTDGAIAIFEALEDNPKSGIAIEWNQKGWTRRLDLGKNPSIGYASIRGRTILGASKASDISGKIGLRDFSFMETYFDNPKAANLAWENEGVVLSDIRLLAKDLEKKKAFRRLNLRRNNIGQDGIKLLSDAFKINPKGTAEAMTSLRLGYTNIGDGGMVTLATALKAMRRLNRLDLSHCIDRNIDKNSSGGEGITALAEALGGMRSLQYLHLSDNPMFVKEAEELATALGKSGTVALLDLSNCKIDDDACKHFGTAFDKMKNLKQLNMFGNDFKEEVKFLSKQNLELYSMKTIKFKNFDCDMTKNELFLASHGLEDVDMLSVAPLLKKMAALESVVLSRNEIGDKGMEHLADSLGSAPRLKTLELNILNISFMGMGCVARGLNTMTALRELNMSRNPIGNNGMEHLANGLEKHIPLAMLDLGDAQIGDKGMEYLARALHKMTALEILKLNSNEVGNKGMEALSTALDNLTQLKNLQLKNNSIEDDGVEHLSGALHSMKTLEVLNLSANNFGDGGLFFLQRPLEMKPTPLKELKSLDLTKNDSIGPLGSAKIKQAWKKQGKNQNCLRV